MSSRILGKYQIIKEDNDIFKYGIYNGNEYRIEIGICPFFS